MRTGRLFLLERQGDLRDELRGVLVLRRAFEINASERPLGREPMLPRVGAELFLRGFWKVLPLLYKQQKPFCLYSSI